MATLLYCPNCARRGLPNGHKIVTTNLSGEVREMIMCPLKPIVYTPLSEEEKEKLSAKSKETKDIPG
jgi:hypothetical protein